MQEKSIYRYIIVITYHIQVEHLSKVPPAKPLGQRIYIWYMVILMGHAAQLKEKMKKRQEREYIEYHQ